MFLAKTHNKRPSNNSVCQNMRRCTLKKAQKWNQIREQREGRRGRSWWWWWKWWCSQLTAAFITHSHSSHTKIRALDKRHCVQYRRPTQWLSQFTAMFASNYRIKQAAQWQNEGIFWASNCSKNSKLHQGKCVISTRNSKQKIY